MGPRLLYAAKWKSGLFTGRGVKPQPFGGCRFGFDHNGSNASCDTWLKCPAFFMLKLALRLRAV